jgi:hypothetical protein
MAATTTLIPMRVRRGHRRRGRTFAEVRLCLGAASGLSLCGRRYTLPGWEGSSLNVCGLDAGTSSTAKSYLQRCSGGSRADQLAPGRTNLRVSAPMEPQDRVVVAGRGIGGHSSWMAGKARLGRDARRAQDLPPQRFGFQLR